MKTKLQQPPKSWANDGVLAEIRKRHHLAVDAPVACKWIDAEFKAADEADKDVFEACINVGCIDRDNEVVLPDGVDLRDYDKSGAGFFNHFYDKVPIFVPGKVKMVGGKLISKAKWLTNELARDVREFVEAMAKAGKSAGVSIGFMPMDERKPSEKDVEKYGPGVQRVFTRWKLLEWSIAPVQSNPEAMVLEIGKSLRAGVAKTLYGIEEPPPAKIIAPTHGKIIVLMPVHKPKVKPRISHDQVHLIGLSAARAVKRQSGGLYI